MAKIRQSMEIENIDNRIESIDVENDRTGLIDSVDSSSKIKQTI